ncbi:TonB-dependent receptor P3 [Arenibacter antarcticus]|uniref:SusC/RagA family TonB-linked outer membrane protein n=1 Tax=Arenibacter antarcticus TaxID=2040469 RepID=A0ABW5VAT4_9FLAO|nr:SusC/RagA family TonB-linked outer membrane protein [Arenibacter sp. H213]
MKNQNLKILMLLLFGMMTTIMFGQQEVRGVITSDAGELLPGVSVVVKGTTTGVTSDFDGNYSISVPSGNAVLAFSYLGMKNKEVTVGSQTTINVVLETSSEELDEVVVTALGISREKKSLGYAVSEVSGDALDNVPQENAMNALSGKVSGVAINSTGGPGSTVNINIRGASSLSSDNQPLFVIDGTPVINSPNNIGGVGRDNKVDYGNAISDINTDDIESMTVLKGASAAALYGSRAGNGVVLITTKSGKAKKGLGVTVNSSTVFDIPYRYLDTHRKFAAGSRPYTEDNYPANSYGAIIIGETSSAWAGPALDQGIKAIHWPYTAQEIASGIPVARELKSYDNAKNFFNTAITSSNNVSIQDNSEKMNYRLSYSNMKHEGFIPNSDLSKHSINLNSGLKLNEKITVSSSINYTKSGADNRPATNRGANPMQALYEIAPHINVLDMKDYWLPGYEGIRQNSPFAFGDDPTDTEWNNPYFLAHEVNNGFERNRFYGNVTGDWQITDEFSAMVRYNFDEINEVRETKMSKGYTGDINGAYGIQDILNNEINIDFLLTYAKKFNDWDFSASAGGNKRTTSSSSVRNSTIDRGSGILTPGLFTLGNIAPDNLVYRSYKSERQVNSLYGLVSVGFKEMFYIDATGRNDWSSTLPDDNNSYFYPSISTSLLINRALNLGGNVSLIKLRAGYAEVGNDTHPYNLEPILNSGSSWGNASRLSVPGTLLNPDLKPESQDSWEIGTDLAFFQNRLRMDFTYYESENKNQIFPVKADVASGYPDRFINAGLITSSGVEAGLSGTLISNGDWNWDMGFVFGRNRTKVMELADGMNSVTFWEDAKGGAITWLGEEIGNIIDRALVRVDDPNSPYHGWPIIDDSGFEDSDRTLEDADGKRVAPVIGNFNPDFTLGMTTSASYKNWSISMNFDWRKGGQFISQTHRYGESDMHTQRWLDKMHNFSDVGDLPTYLKNNEGKYLSENGEFYVLVGGATANTGGYPVSEGGITLNDGVFMPGVQGDYDGNGNFVATTENLGGPGTVYTRYQDHYGWDFARTSAFDADFLKLREISLTYSVPSKAIRQIGLQNVAISLFSRNIILWTKADIGVDPEMAFQQESSEQGKSGIQFKQGIERFNVSPWAIPVGFKLNVSF